MEKNIDDSVYFVVNGPVVGKGRPRVTTRGGFARAYTPKRTTDCEEMIKEAYRREYPEGVKYQDKEPLIMVVNVYMQIPKSTPKKLRERMLLGYERPTKKPDSDNLFKTVADALNGVAYTDDSQIITATINKWYSEEPKAEISIRKWVKE